MATAQEAIWLQTSQEQLDAVFLDVCGELQLVPTRCRLAIERYGAVNQLLERLGSPFQFFRPRIFPQGSMALRTTSKPVAGPHDLDFVLQIDAPYWLWHPLAGLNALYQFLSSNETYRKMIFLKNRVVRLTHADEFCMDTNRRNARLCYFGASTSFDDLICSCGTCATTVTSDLQDHNFRR